MVRHAKPRQMCGRMEKKKKKPEVCLATGVGVSGKCRVVEERACNRGSTVLGGGGVVPVGLGPRGIGRWSGQCPIGVAWPAAEGKMWGSPAGDREDLLPPRIWVTTPSPGGDPGVERPRPVLGRLGGVIGVFDTRGGRCRAEKDAIPRRRPQRQSGRGVSSKAGLPLTVSAAPPGHSAGTPQNESEKRERSGERGYTSRVVEEENGQGAAGLRASWVGAGGRELRWRPT
jgi:hypothetical protein